MNSIGNVMFNKQAGVFYWVDPIKYNPRVYWTASKTLCKKHVSWESKQRFKLWGEDISMQEKQAMQDISIFLYKEY